MNIAVLLNSEIEEIIDFRGHQVFVVISPDVYTMDEMGKLDENNPAAVAEYIVKGFKNCGVIVGDKREDITDEKNKKIPITAENLLKYFSASFVRQVLTRIETLKLSVEGKPNSPTG